MALRTCRVSQFFTEGTRGLAHVEEHVELRGVDQCDASDLNVGAQVHAEEVGAMVGVVQYDVPPPVVASAVDKASALHRHVVAIVKLNRGLASPLLVPAASRPRFIQTLRVPEEHIVFTT